MPSRLAWPKLAYPQLAPLWLAVFIDILGFTILIPFLPFFSQEFNASAWQIGLLLSTNAIFGFFSGPLWGAWSDARGRKPMLLLSQLGTLVGFLILAFSGNMTMLFVSRIVDGLFGGNFPIAKAVIGDVVPPQGRSTQMTNVGVCYVLASLFGPGLGGLLSRWGIMAPGLLSASLSLLTIVLTFFYLRESNPRERRVAHAQASARAQGVAPSSSTAAASAAAVAARPGPPTTGRGPTGTAPVSRSGNRDIWGDPTSRWLLIQWAFHTMSFMIYISCVSLFANYKLGLNARQVGLLLMISGIVRVLIRFVVFPPLLRRLGDRGISMLGLGIFVVSYFSLGFVVNQVQFAIALCAVSFAASCSRGVLTGFLSRAVKPWQQGRAMGLSSSLDSLAQIVGPLAGGIILDALPVWVYGGLAGVFALGAFLLAFRRLDFAQPSRLGSE